MYIVLLESLWRHHQEQKAWLIVILDNLLPFWKVFLDIEKFPQGNLAVNNREILIVIAKVVKAWLQKQRTESQSAWVNIDYYEVSNNFFVNSPGESPFFLTFPHNSTRFTPLRYIEPKLILSLVSGNELNSSETVKGLIFESISLTKYSDYFSCESRLNLITHRALVD